MEVIGLLVRLIWLVPLGLWMPVAFVWLLGATTCEQECGWMAEEWAVIVFADIPIVLFALAALEFAVALLRRLVRWWRS